jgi:hypothetical protein
MGGCDEGSVAFAALMTLCLAACGVFPKLKAALSSAPAAAGGLGLPIIGRLLGHVQVATTARYAHLDNDPLRRASEAIARRIAAALDGNRKAALLPLRKRA